MSYWSLVNFCWKIPQKPTTDTDSTMRHLPPLFLRFDPQPLRRSFPSEDRELLWDISTVLEGLV